MLLTDKVLYKIDADCSLWLGIGTHQERRLLIKEILILLRPIFLVFIEHVLDSYWVKGCLQFDVSLSINDNDEIQIFPYRKKFTILQKVRSLNLQKGATAHPRI